MRQSGHIHNISLVGFMGTGKTSVGHIVASLLHFHMVDTDELIEARAGKRISSIFSQEGEKQFREYERIIVAELAQHRKTVISTGGGLVVNPENMASLKTHSLVLCLWASPETIFERVRHQTHRPLLHCGEPLAKIKNLLAERDYFYRQADVLLNTELRSVKEVALQVVHHFRIAQSNSSTAGEGENQKTS